MRKRCSLCRCKFNIAQRKWSKPISGQSTEDDADSRMDSAIGRDQKKEYGKWISAKICLALLPLDLSIKKTY